MRVSHWIEGLIDGSDHGSVDVFMDGVCRLQRTPTRGYTTSTDRAIPCKKLSVSWLSATTAPHAKWYGKLDSHLLP